jgi:lipopolysaccharide transport protein LptA
MKKIVFLCVLWLAGAVGLALGQETVSTNAASLSTNHTIITSDRLEYDYPGAIAVFSGNVLVRDKDLKMWADKMTVIFAPNEEIESVTAIGRVVIIQPGRRADCRKAIFLMDRNEVILTGDAKVVQGNDRVEGRVIHIWTDTDRMVSEPGHLVVSSKEPEAGSPSSAEATEGRQKKEVGEKQVEGGDRKLEAGEEWPETGRSDF